MKVCPFCDFENEDSASKCEACGTQLTDEAVSVATEVEENESGLYTVLMQRNSYRWIIKMLKKHFNLKGKVAKAKCMLGEIDGLTKAEADELVAKIRNPILPARAVPANKVAEYKAKISKDKVWFVRLFSGETLPDVIAYFKREFEFEFDNNSEAEEYLNVCVHEDDGRICESDIQDEAMAMAAKLRELGAEATVEFGDPI